MLDGVNTRRGVAAGSVAGGATVLTQVVIPGAVDPLMLGGVFVAAVMLVLLLLVILPRLLG
ncbi:hypothetical protein [Halorarius halobius]|uniref:hypothetical protein n=1 Tax=Halorarius halobius TaxID=2962671 RepID=UPI0020CC3B8B|nr:hypothetical protein [Halorarius halobius]